MRLTILAATLAILASSAEAQQQKPPDPAADLRENFLALTIAYNHAVRALDLYMAQAGQDTAALAMSESSKKWILDNWVPGKDADERLKWVLDNWTAPAAPVSTPPK